MAPSRAAAGSSRRKWLDRNRLLMPHSINQVLQVSDADVGAVVEGLDVLGSGVLDIVDAVVYHSLSLVNFSRSLFIFFFKLLTHQVDAKNSNHDKGYLGNRLL